MTMSTPKNGLSEPIKSRVVRADHRVVSYLWNRGESLYRLPERLLVLGEFEGPGFLETRQFAESPNSLLLQAPDGVRSVLTGSTTLGQGRYLVISPRAYPACELRFRSFEPPIGESVLTSAPFFGTGWLTGGEAELDGAKQRSKGSTEFPIPFFEECVPIGDRKNVEILVGRERSKTTGGWEMANIEVLRKGGLTVQNLSKPEELAASWPNGESETRIMACHLNEMRWTITVDHPVIGLLLFRTYDAFHGLSQVRVFINDQQIGRWFCPEQDRTHRWRQSAFGMEFETSLEPGDLAVTIDPPAGAPLWSVSSYRWILFHD